MTAKLDRLLTNANYYNFVGLDDKKYSFTKEERELIIKRGGIFRGMEKEVVHQVCQRLASASRNLDSRPTATSGDDDALAKLDQRIIDLAKSCNHHPGRNQQGGRQGGQTNHFSASI